jgi:hypothetical protein
MISRKKILSRSQSDLDYPQNYNPYECEDDLWFSKDKLYQDHVTEILKKWEQIDDEIWGKIICMERNRRIAKAYARLPVLTINGSEDGFDGYKIGLNGFENPLRDALTKRVKSHIGRGVRLKMDELGNIIIKRMSNCDVYVRGWDKESNSVSQEIISLSGELGFEKSVKLFDMKKFQSGIGKELRSAYPDRRRLENQCICAIALVKDSADILDLPSWVLLVNIVALDLLKSRFPNISYNRESTPKFVSIFEQQKAILNDEDPYSIPSAPSSPNPRLAESQAQPGKSLSSGVSQKPPDLPPRDFAKTKKGKTKNLPQALKSLVKESIGKTNGGQPSSKGQMKKCDADYEDPYYCGLRARVTNFGGRQRKSLAAPSYEPEIRKAQSNGYLNSLFNRSSSFYPRGSSSHYSHYDSSLESDVYGISSGSGYDIYAPVTPLYGRLRAQLSYKREEREPTPQRRVPFQEHRQRYATEWD